jgi:hypothetical protein
MTLRRAHLRELCIDTSGPPATRTVLWSVVFPNTPLLEVLSVSRGDMLTWIPPIVRAAARLCPRLQALEFSNEWYTRHNAPTEEAVLATVLKCLPRWKPFDGLRHLDLSIPFKKIPYRETWTTRYVKALAKNCPKTARRSTTAPAAARASGN